MTLREHVQRWMRGVLRSSKPEQERPSAQAPVKPSTKDDSPIAAYWSPSTTPIEPSPELAAYVDDFVGRMAETERSDSLEIFPMSELDRTHEKARGLRNRYFGLMKAINTPSARRTQDGDNYVEFDAEDTEPREWYDAAERHSEVIYAELLLFLDRHRGLEQRDDWKPYYEEIATTPRLKIEGAAERQDQIERGAEVAGNDRGERFAQRNDRSYLDQLQPDVAGTEGYGDELRSAFYREEYGLEPLSPQARDAVLANDEPPF